MDWELEGGGCGMRIGSARVRMERGCALRCSWICVSRDIASV